MERARAPRCGAPARLVRRPALLGLDVPSAAGGGACDDDPRPRPDPPPGLGDSPHALHARAEVPERGSNVRCRLRELRVHRGRRRRDVGRAGRAHPHRASGGERRVPARRTGRGPRRALPAHGRRARAEEESRRARRRAARARRTPARRRGRRVGERRVRPVRRGDPTARLRVGEVVRVVGIRPERERLRAAGLEHARRFTWGAVGEAFLRGYREAATR